LRLAPVTLLATGCIVLTLGAGPALTGSQHAAVYTLDLGTGQTTRLTHGADDDYEPAWSPDGKRIAFTRCCPGKRSLIYLLTLATGRAMPLPHSTAGCTAHWAPDGERIAFAGRGGVRVVGLDGELIAVWKGTEPSWSPDGRRVAYVIPSAGVWIKNADGTGQRVLDTPLKLFATFGTAWSPNGRLIAFSAVPFDTPKDEEHLYVVRPDGTGTRRLTDGGRAIQDSQPAWSPDGRRLAFYRFDPRHRTGRALALDIRTGRVAPIPGGEGAQHPRWSPDGKRIAFDRGGGIQPTSC
jgi:Tol biopolymer transport system component